MNLVSLERVTRRHAEKLVLDGVTLGVDDGDRVGVIGVNGSGKSTLLRLIAGVDEPDAGRVVHANRLRVDYVPQDATLSRGQAALEAVLDGYRPPGPVEESWRAEHRARAKLDRLGIRDADRLLSAMSGGQRKRVALARALTRADAEAAVGETASLLVLDEPTNHLDIDVVEWLETELRQRGGGLVLVSHDRYLLDRVTTRVVEVDRGRLYPYHGSYAAYLEDRAAREEHAAAAEGKRQARARVELAWLRRNPSARTTKARARVERAQALVEADPHRPRPELRIALPARRIGSKVVNLHSVGKAYDGRWVIRGFDHKLAAGERVGVVGPNGSGKTTLLRLVAGLEQPDEGSVRHGATVHVGFYGQDPRPLPPRTRVLDAVKDVVAETNTVDGLTLSAAQILERFLFPPLAQKAYVSELSGGERRRLELLRVLATAPNLLLLDEPTNDLDLDTLAVLEDYLDTWPGTLVAASHDRFFLDRVCGHLLSLEPDGGVRDHPGGWSAYRASRQRGPRQPVGGPATERPSRRTRKLSYNERRELGALSGRIAELERRRTELGEAVAAAGSDFIEAQARSAELADVLEELDEAESRWLELSIIEEA